MFGIAFCVSCVLLYFYPQVLYIQAVECLLIKQNLNEIRPFVNYLGNFTGILFGNITCTARICCTFVCEFAVGTVILHLIVGKYLENIKVNYIKTLM